MPPYQTPELGEGVPDEMQKDADRIYKELRETTYHDETPEDKGAAAGTMWKRLKFTWRWDEDKKRWFRKTKSNTTVTNVMPMVWCPQTNAAATNRCAIFDNVTLQGLDQWLPDDEGHVQGTFYPLAAFEPTAAEWGDGVPIVYAPLHLPVGMFAKNPEEALRRASNDKLKARIVGYSTSSAILKKDVGRPLLKVSLGKICDQEVQERHAKAALGISSAFACDQTEDGKYITGNVHPDHILLFPRDPLKGSEQRDMTAIVNAMIKEMEEYDVIIGTQINKGAEFSAKNRGKIHGMIQDLRAHSGMIDRLCSTMEDMMAVRDPNEQPAASENLEPLLKRAGESNQHNDAPEHHPERPAGYKSLDPIRDPFVKPIPVNLPEENKSTSYPYVPHNPAKYKKTTGSWNKPTLEDFERAGHHWDDPAGKTFILSCFAAVTGETFGDCRLPHHETDGALNANGVRNALARLPQTQGLGTASDAAKSHLESHLAEFHEDETQAGENEQTNTQQETINMADNTNKKAEAEDRKNRFRKLAEDMKKCAEGEDVSEDKMKKFAEDMMNISGIPAPIDKNGKTVPGEGENRKAEAEDKKADAEGKKTKAKAKSDAELEEEAEGEGKGEETEEDKKKSTAQNARINTLEQKLAKMEAKETATKKGDFANMLKPGHQKDIDTLFPQFVEDPVHFMRVNKAMFQDGAYETTLTGLEHVPESSSTRTNKSIANMTDAEFDKYVQMRGVQLNARISGPGGYSSVGTNVRRDPNNPNAFHANMLGQTEG